MMVTCSGIKDVRVLLLRLLDQWAYDNCKVVAGWP